MIYNFRRRSPRQSSINVEPSRTVPGQALSLRELLNRNMQGNNVRTYSPVYSQEHPGLERLDDIDRAQMMRDLADFQVSQRGKIITARQARIEAARAAASNNIKADGLADNSASQNSPSSDQ